jgi:two-component sensor histidine kinase
VVVREAIDNALAYAFPEGREGRVWVKLVPDEGRLRLTIRDSGIGITDLPPAPAGGAGVIGGLARRLGGYARLGSAPFGGGLVTMVFPQDA